MKNLVRIHDKMVDVCVNAYNSLIGYNKVLDSFNQKSVQAERPGVIVKKQ